MVSSMDTQTENAPAERKRGTVRNFASLPDKLLENMRLDVGLDMPVYILKQLQQYYKNTEKRDPTLDELYFLDSYITLRRAGEIPITELLTDAPYIVETYADLLEKRALVDRDTGPLTPDNAAHVVGRYLRRSGRSPDLDRRVVIAAGEDAELRLMFSGARPLVATDFGAVGYSRRTKPESGSQLIILTPAGDMTRGDFTSRVGRVLQSCGSAPICGAVVGRSGIAGAIATLCDGAYVNLSAIPGVSEPHELDELCGAAYRDVLIAAEPSRSGGILAAAAAESLPAATIGGINYGKKLIVKYNRFAPVSLDMSLIRTPARCSGEKYIVREQKRAAESRIVTSRCHDPASGLLLATAHSPGGSDPFFISLDTVLTAAAQCVAGGADFTGVALSLCGSIPAECSEPQAGGDILAMILGAYRAQIEYCLPDAGSIYSYFEQDFGFTAAAAALPASRPVPTGFSKPGSYVYLCAPAYSPGGLPDFESLRRMWKYVSATVRAGLVSSAVALGEGGAAGATRAMSGSIVFEPAENTDMDLMKAPMPGGIIVESNLPLEGVCIGKTRPAGGYISI